MKQNNFVIFTGLFIGAFAVILTMLGSPQNMGICVACFIRDISGSLGLHRAEVVQYLRPEILGLFLEHSLYLYQQVNLVHEEDLLLLQVYYWLFVMVGALVFLGCP